MMKLDHKHSKHWIYKFLDTGLIFSTKDRNVQLFVTNILGMNICRTHQTSPILLFVAVITNLKLIKSYNHLINHLCNYTVLQQL